MEPIRKLKVKQQICFSEAQENGVNQDAIGFSFESDWLKKCNEFPEPIRIERKAKSK